MSSPIVIHVLRPYASEEEYLAHERFSIGLKSMLLIDQPALPVDTAVAFDVALSNGQKPIRAEGKVVAHEPASSAHPGGLRVRFKRYGAATKAFLERAVHSASASLAPAGLAASLPPAADAASRPPVAESSGVHRKLGHTVTAPTNREALLERLRARRVG